MARSKNKHTGLTIRITRSKKRPDDNPPRPARLYISGRIEAAGKLPLMTSFHVDLTDGDDELPIEYTIQKLVPGLVNMLKVGVPRGDAKETATS